MDDELREMLMTLIEGQTETKSDLKNIDRRLTKVELIQDEIRKDVKESIDVLKDMTGRHEVDINILKRRPV